MKTVVILSGGMDSTVLLHRCANMCDEVHAISVCYGQKHAYEIDCAAWQCEKLGIPHKIVQVPILSGSSLTDSGKLVPEGHYAADNMKATVVPNRNMVLLSLAASYAISLAMADGDKRVDIAYGAHAGDHEIYPDCRKDFVGAMRHALALCDWVKVDLEVPFLDLTKADIVGYGHDMDVDFSRTQTCYNGGIKACGRCGTCVERLEAFEKAGFADPLEYIDREYWKTVVKS